MPMFMDTDVEVAALLVTLVIAVPAILLFLCILEESPLKTDAFEDIPVFCGLASAADCFGYGASSLICFFFITTVMLGVGGSAGMWYMIWRGTVASSLEGSQLDGMFSLLQAGHRGRQDFQNRSGAGPVLLGSIGDASWGKVDINTMTMPEAAKMAAKFSQHSRPRSLLALNRARRRSNTNAEHGD
mmetsp:Transcript_132478/g.247776  ORF Transcript_132478/g.247776 Transcript_132478/m.247776 type:complete len:186 (-) Transcript_132478:108-665(-)